jgi:hypothetical protein
MILILRERTRKTIKSSLRLFKTTSFIIIVIAKSFNRRLIGTISTTL